MSPLLANIALAVLDEHVHGPSLEGGTMSTPRRRARRRAKGLQNWRIARYADDFVILVHRTRDDAKTLHDDIALVLEPLGLRLPRPGPRSCTWTTGSISWASASSGNANGEPGSGTSAPSSPPGRSGR